MVQMDCVYRNNYYLTRLLHEKPEQLYIAFTHLGWESCEQTMSEWMRVPENRTKQYGPMCEAVIPGVC